MCADVASGGHAFSVPSIDRTIAAEVESIVAVWPRSDSWTAEVAASLDAERQHAARELAARSGQQLEPTLVSILANQRSEERLFLGAASAYATMRLSTRPLEQMLLAPNIREDRQLYLFVLLSDLEAPLQSGWVPSAGTTTQLLRLGTGRKNYTCVVAGRLFLPESSDSTTRARLRFLAAAVFQQLLNEVNHGSLEAREFLGDPSIKRTTELLVAEGYLSRQ